MPTIPREYFNTMDTTIIDEGFKYKGHTVKIKGRIHRENRDFRKIKCSVYEPDKDMTLNTKERKHYLEKSVFDKILEKMFSMYNFQVPDTKEVVDELVEEAKEDIDKAMEYKIEYQTTLDEEE